MVGRRSERAVERLARVLTEQHPRRGDVYWVDFSPARGSEQAGHRPACVISLDSFNKAMPVVVVAAITSQIKGGNLCVLLPEGKPLPKRGEIMPFQVMTVSKDRLGDFAGSLRLDQIKALEAKMRLCWGL